jgi:hypothetical protein
MNHSLSFDFNLHEEIDRFTTLIGGFNRNAVPYEVNQSPNGKEITVKFSNGF